MTFEVWPSWHYKQVPYLIEKGRLNSLSVVCVNLLLSCAAWFISWGMLREPCWAAQEGAPQREREPGKGFLWRKWRLRGHLSVSRHDQVHKKAMTIAPYRSQDKVMGQQNTAAGKKKMSLWRGLSWPDHSGYHMSPFAYRGSARSPHASATAPTQPPLHPHMSAKPSAWGTKCPPETHVWDARCKNADSEEGVSEKYINVISSVALTGVFLAVSMRKHLSGKMVFRQLSLFLEKKIGQTF